MSLLSKNHKDTNEKTQKFIVNLAIAEDEVPYVKSCEVINGTFRNRTSFSRDFVIDKIFTQKVALGIQHCIDKLTQKNEVVSLPTYVVEAEKIVLAGANVISRANDQNGANIILRFNLFLGSISGAFNPEIGFQNSLEGPTDAVSMEILSDIAMPLLNLCIAVETGDALDARRAQKFLDTLSDRSYEIKFQIELIKRFVENNERGLNDVELPSTPSFKALL
ncbi:hypothetical protein EDD53_0563 [Pacificibacter maritimus]|uniref:Uncharacterized protein n=1 Tax=Pacificibacter maritimus TaxID=762213 RepID=A0A3N4VEW2_9RHOB|nr:hypothetical protein [Pacificibacter maritimus]RPE71444.1 hypothetical protein EDD53_0563 [Pacificibacter maritimus]